MIKVDDLIKVKSNEWVSTIAKLRDEGHLFIRNRIFSTRYAKPVDTKTHMADILLARDKGRLYSDV